jgi:hypothetical protein
MIKVAASIYFLLDLDQGYFYILDFNGKIIHCIPIIFSFNWRFFFFFLSFSPELDYIINRDKKALMSAWRRCNER